MRNSRIKYENINLTDYQKEYIKNNWTKRSDARIAVNIKSTKDIVRYYRNGALGAIKTPGRIGNSGRKLVDMAEINMEIEALQKFANYPSFMNGAKDRMKYLMSFNDGKRCN